MTETGDAEQQGPSRRFVVGSEAIAARPIEPGLHIVATPIGNLGDVTLRALETLAGADILACEDTRVTRILLARYGIRRRAVAYHEHNAAETGPRLLAEIEAGRSVALVSDAGTPLISDPGYRLVASVRAAGLKVIPIPGASAVLAALTVSGLATDAFFFAGFLPQKADARRRRLEEIAVVPGTLILYESPHRLAASLSGMAETLGPRAAVVARELTKTFEEVRPGTLPELAAHYAEAGAPKGEIVVCVAQREAEAAPEAADLDALLISLASEMGPSKAAGEAARMTGQKKALLYRRLMALKASGGGDGA